MKRRSSIFSFETPEDRPHLGRAVLLAAIFVVAAEAATRIALHNGWLEPDFSLHRLTAGYIDTLRRDKPNLWLLGNSTLGRGIDGDVLAGSTCWKPILLAHGTASLAGSVAMFEYYLERAPHPPSMVIVFLSKDDLNAHGYRAKVSTRYLDWAEKGAPFDLDEWLALSAAKQAIVRSFQRSLAGLLMPAGVSGRFERPPAYDGTPIPYDEPHFTDLARDFTQDLTPLHHLTQLCREEGIPEIQVVLMPVTDRYIAFHDGRFPNTPYSRIRKRLATACRASGIAFHDYGEPTDEYDLFSDPFHLNAKGKRQLSESLRTALFPVPPAPRRKPPSRAELARETAAKPHLTFGRR